MNSAVEPNFKVKFAEFRTCGSHEQLTGPSQKNADTHIIFFQCNPKIHLVCVWQKLFLLTYFTIQLIFASIHGPQCILFMGFTILFQLIFTFIYNNFNKKFQFQQNNLIPNRPLLPKFFLYK